MKLLFISLFSWFILFGEKSFSYKPLVWEMSELSQMRKDRKIDTRVLSLLSAADGYCEDNPVAIVDKTKLTFEPNIHYYCSVGPYWWPDPQDSGHYINKDGFVNPDSKNYDNIKLSELCKRCQNLSKAFYITREIKYYRSFIIQIRTWFIDESTYMMPTFEYAQIIPGQNMNKGRSTGMIDAYILNSLIESVRLVNSVKRIDKRTMRALKEWFYAFASDSESRFNKIFMQANNNVSLAYDVLLTNMYLFCDQEKEAVAIVDNFYERRINVQIKEDGSQPSELARTNAYAYSLYNLTHIIDMCYLARYWYPNYYQEHRERIDKAFDFLGQYVDNPQTFPYQQISGWEECQTNYYKQLNRLKSL